MDWSVESDYLPGEYRRAILDRYNYGLPAKIEYIQNALRKFKPNDDVNLFQDFLNAQRLLEPGNLFADKLPQTPLGNFASYLDN